MGVGRAVSLATATAEATATGAGASASPGPQGHRVFTLGPLIHNPQTVAELEAKGIFAIEMAKDGGFVDGKGRPVAVAGASVVIRAHGVPPQVKSSLAAAGAKIVDATCPRVLASQKKAAGYASRGYTVVIAGDRDHGEVTGIAGFAPGARIVASPEEAQALRTEGPLALIAQTTIKKEEYQAIREALALNHPLLEVVDSICPATADRLKALEDLARDCEAIVIVGGRNSANTKRLLATALELGRPAWLVEGPADLDPGLGSYASVGLTAGASTPDAAIDAVEARLLALDPGVQKPLP